MAKKSFKSLPQARQQPTAEQIESFVNNGTGTDQTGKEQTQDEPTRRLSIDVPESLHTRFKVACAKTRAKMAPEIIAFIEKRVRELENNAP